MNRNRLVGIGRLTHQQILLTHHHVTHSALSTSSPITTFIIIIIILTHSQPITAKGGFVWGALLTKIAWAGGT